MWRICRVAKVFETRVNAMGRRPYWPSRMAVSYCTFGVVAIIRRDLRTLSLPRDSPRDNLRGVLDLSPRGKGNSRQMKLLGELSYEKIRRYNNSPPYVTARWPPQRISPLNFLMRNRTLFENSLLEHKSPSCTSSEVFNHIHIQSPDHHVDLDEVKIFDREHRLLRGVKAIYIR